MNSILFKILAMLILALSLLQCDASSNLNKILNLCTDKSSDAEDKLEYILKSDSSLANAKTEGGESALHLACIWGNPRIVTTLLKYGADPNYRSSKIASSLDMTPLTWCVYAGYVDAVKEFLADPRTNVNLVVRQEDGNLITAMDIAAKIENMPMQSLLQEFGAKSFEKLSGSSINGMDPNLMPKPLAEEL